MTKKSTVNHFKVENIPERTIYSIIQTYLKTRTTQGLPRSGRPQKLDKKLVKRLVNEFNNKDGRSQRVAALKYKRQLFENKWC